MKRIRLGPSQTHLPTSPAPKVEQSLLTFSQRGDFPHVIFVPLHYERNYCYPLLIWLHGPGDNETQLKRIMPLVSMRNYVAAGPRGTWAEDGGRSSCLRFQWRQTDRDIDAAEQRVFDSVELAREGLHISLSRVFLAGYDCGGTMALRIGLKYPDRFAGVLSLGGPFPAGRTPLLQLDRAREVPLLIGHGRNSRTYPMDQVCRDLRLFHSAGMSVTLREYPCGEEITTKMLSDVNVWIMEQVTGVEASSFDKTSYDPGSLN